MLFRHYILFIFVYITKYNNAFSYYIYMKVLCEGLNKHHIETFEIKLVIYKAACIQNNTLYKWILYIEGRLWKLKIFIESQLVLVVATILHGHVFSNQYCSMYCGNFIVATFFLTEDSFNITEIKYVNRKLVRVISYDLRLEIFKRRFFHSFIF